MIKLLTPADGAVVSQQTERQKYFREHSRELAVAMVIDWRHLVDTGEKDNSFPEPVVFTWRGEGTAVTLADNPDFRNAVTVTGEKGKARVVNLQLGTAYWWKVGGSEVRTFTTEDIPPRWIYVDGITNVRDAGGWKTEDGRKIKQGLLYRGSEMDTHKTITEDGIRTLREEIGIRTDLDIRGEAVGKVTESPLGQEVRFALLPAHAYESFIADPVNLQETFALLADPESYPVYYHCWGGADRTGTYGYLIGAILGMTDEDLLLDYELTSLSVWGCRSRDSEGFRAVLAGLEPYGTTTKERAVGFLLDHGVSVEHIEAIRNILLED
ncbi:MAG: tyrosine-protein phosphatase [Clostridia bacterium]|nr:tyrosine-protein phosphatase [Clostridia bacterium]